MRHECGRHDSGDLDEILGTDISCFNNGLAGAQASKTKMCPVMERITSLVRHGATLSVRLPNHTILPIM